ncbi:hypothetical protein Lfu02_77100 [Longispora fulva]|uniref:Murein DD-endopeptidase MepM/ murein hydrolase activator NlpD n=1 Tax=Longispora fulva TaxID=619741 RepID=A0A8J7GSE3_9ACTN|nr:M23 family metallopeptidase [Longispora fulva]MBG6136171.1 murein DD-endopeptidase MepM/ murein hydrolase activator NlpD [Longispora fulva]GIG63338.1 hypothetical protein Lfu02_77100 [Longispora fulva]
MTGKVLAFIAAGVLGLIVACAGLAALTGGASGGGLCSPMPTPTPHPQASASPGSTTTGITPRLAPSAGAWPPVGPWSSEQVSNAATITATGQRLRVPPRGWIIAVATAMQESALRNLGDLGPDNDHDSLGLFQQRPSAGWGTPAQIMDPVHASTKFYEKMLTITGWQNLPLTVVAQTVQVSAYPDAYAKHETPATQLVAALTGVTGSVGACGGSIGPMGWTQPVREPVTSGFGPRGPEHILHAGVDLASPKGTPIHAAAAGTVTVAACNAPPNWGCDRDGSERLPGCGWYVDIDHGSGILTRYCHMLARPSVTVGQQVTAGQIIGITGSSGNSSGPHLHLEVHLGGDGTNAGAVDPVPYFAARGAPLASP